MDIRKGVNEFQAKPFSRGQAFKCMNRGGRVYTYLISYGLRGRVFLANLETGKAWDKDVVAVDPTSLSPAEAAALFDGLEIIAALEVSTKEIEVTKPGRPFKVGQLLRCQHPGKERETIVQIAYSDVPGNTVRLVTMNGQYPGHLCGNPVTVQDAMEITQAEFNQMNPNLEPIEEVKPTFEVSTKEREPIMQIAYSMAYQGERAHHADCICDGIPRNAAGMTSDTTSSEAA